MKNVLRYIVLAIALCVFCYSGYQLFTIFTEYKKGSDEYSALENEYVLGVLDEEGNLIEGEDGIIVDGKETAMKNPIDFTGLREKNEDIIGWLKVDALDISYPVAQGEDNEFYLHNTFEKTYNFAGCLFIDMENEDDFSDPNTIIYGHNMKNGSMFGTLKKLKTQETVDENPYFWVYTPDWIYKYEIFSSLDVSATDETYQLNYEKDKKFQKYIENCRSRSMITSDLEVEAGDDVVTLSTCTGDSATRCIVQGKKIETYKAL